MDTLKGGAISADPRRRAALLQLAKAENPANERWDGALSYGKWMFLTLAPAGLMLFGAVWPSARLLTGFWAGLSFAGLLLVLLPALVRKIFGLQSAWHKFDGEELLLGEDYLEFSMYGVAPGFRRDVPYVWRMRYADVRRLEYDRKQKCLRIVGRFDEDASRKADAAGLPKGMRPMAHPEARPEGAVYLELFLIFPEADRLLEELEERCGVYMHPARRADDMADLRDLPGLNPEKQVIKPMIAGLVFFAAIFLIALSIQGGWLEQNPYRPYPPTEKSMLGKAFGVGESAVLDGLRITLKSADGDSGYDALLVFELENTCELPVHFHNVSDRQSNVRAEVMTQTGPERREARGDEDGLVRIEPGGVYNMKLRVELGSDNNDAGLIISINSDRWPLEKPFWREEYTGGTVEIGGKMVKDNEVVFYIDGLK